jgi:hypothetical protein
LARARFASCQTQDITTGKRKPLKFQAAPFFFLFPKPSRFIDEACTESGGIYQETVKSLVETLA